MYIRVSDREVELLDRGNFHSFKVVVHGTSEGLEALRQALEGVALVADTKTAWVAEEVLRSWISDDEAWQQRLTAMIEKAHPHGWIDPRTGAIKAHIEWEAPPMTTQEICDTLRDGFK
jgi:hypothetical protein